MTRQAQRGLTRRALLAGAGLGAASAVLPAASAWAADYSVVPRLPGEISRLATQTSRLGRKAYEAIDIEFSGDRSRIFVPHGVKPGKNGTPAVVVWFYHSFGTTYEALSAAYLYSAMMCVDRGWVCIGPNFGGDLWVNTSAIWHQREISRYMSTYFTISHSFLRANSGGGALMAYAYGKRYVPQARGMYLANAAYDMEDLYARDPARVGPAYAGDPAAIRATNPARLHLSAWNGTRIRAAVSEADPVVPPAQHAQALVAKALPVAKEATLWWHDGGHAIPDVHQDMINAFRRWQA